MPNNLVPISSLPTGSALSGAEIMPVVQSGTTIQTTVSAFKTYVDTLTGPASSTDNAIVRWDGTTGRLMQNSNVIIDDSDNITGAGSFSIGSGLSGTQKIGVGTVGSAWPSGSSSVYEVNESLSAAASATRTIFNVTSTASGTSGSTSFFGFSFLLDWTSSGTLTNMNGITGVVRCLGSGTITNAVGVGSRVRNTGTITTGYAFRVVAPTNSGTIGTLYGLHIPSQKITGVTTAYGVASDGASDLNYFLGNMGLGVSAPTAYAHCAGSTTAKASLRIASGTAPTSPNDGDTWYDGSNVKFYLSSISKTFSFVEDNIQIIARLTGIDGKATSNNLAYTNNSGKTLVITGTMVRCTAASAITNGPTVAVGTTAGGTDIFAAVNLAALTTTTSVFGFGPVGMSVVVPNSGTVYFNVTVAATGTSQTIAAEIMGYFI